MGLITFVYTYAHEAKIAATNNTNTFPSLGFESHKAFIKLKNVIREIEEMFYLDVSSILPFGLNEEDFKNRWVLQALIYIIKEPPVQQVYNNHPLHWQMQHLHFSVS